ADKLSVSVAVGGGAPTVTSVGHTRGQTSGTLEIDFPKGYPKAQNVTVQVTALMGGVVLGSVTGEKALVDGCEAVSLSITGHGSDGGGSGGSGMDGAAGTGGVDGGPGAGGRGVGGGTSDGGVGGNPGIGGTGVGGGTGIGGGLG